MTKVYTKDSFDRFGDDLCEDILSCLLLEDGLKYECVSKQWKRTVYQRVDKMNFDYSNPLTKMLFSVKQLEEEVPALTSLLKKCPNIKHIYFTLIEVTMDNWYKFYNTDDIIVEMVSKYCHNLKSIHNLSKGLSRPFIESIEHKLETIVLIDSMKYFEKLICERFASLRRLNLCFYFNKTHFDSSDPQNFSIKRLTHLKVTFCSNEEDFLRTIIRNNKQLKRLDINAFSEQFKTSEDLLSQLSDLTQLESLAIRLSIGMQSIDMILDKFKIIGKKCRKLKKLSIDDYHYNIHLRLMWLKIIEFYPNLVSLEITSYENYNKSFVEPKISSKLLANCPNLQHLKLCVINMSHIFFKDIHKYVPKLRHLSIHEMKTNEVIIDYFQKLPELQTFFFEDSSVKYFDIEPRIDLEHLIQLFDNCDRLKSAHLKYKREKYKLHRGYYGKIIYE